MTYKKTNRREDDSRGRNSKGRNVERSNSRDDRNVERPHRDEPSLAKRNLAGRNADKPKDRNVERSNSRNDRNVEDSQVRKFASSQIRDKGDRPVRRERGDPSWKEFNEKRSERPKGRGAEKSKGRNVERSNSRNSERPKGRNIERPNSRTKTEGAFDKFDIDKMRERKTQSLEKKNSKRTRYVRNDSSDRKVERSNSRNVERSNRDEPSLAKRNLAGRNSERPNSRDAERPKGRKVEDSQVREFANSQVRKQDDDSTIRLNRYIANSGVCSRRKADELIEKGEVTVNGEVVRELGYKVKYSDKIKFQGKLLKPGKLVYVLLNKPKDYITTMDDPMERRTVVDLTSKITSERIYPVGRLDRNTTGLLLLTNDGDLADKLSHPRNQVKKVYEVELDKSLSSSDFEKVKNGVELEDGPAKVDQISYLDGKSKKFVGVEIHIGRNRIVRRIFESLGYEVVRLDRVIYAGLTKKDLPRGRCRLLTKEELIYLKHLNKY